MSSVAMMLTTKGASLNPGMVFMICVFGFAWKRSSRSHTVAPTNACIPAFAFCRTGQLNQWLDGHGGYESGDEL